MKSKGKRIWYWIHKYSTYTNKLTAEISKLNSICTAMWNYIPTYKPLKDITEIYLDTILKELSHSKILLKELNKRRIYYINKVIK